MYTCIPFVSLICLLSSSPYMYCCHHRLILLLLLLYDCSSNDILVKNGFVVKDKTSAAADALSRVVEGTLGEPSVRKGMDLVYIYSTLVVYIDMLFVL